MSRIFHPILYLLACATKQELGRQLQFLKAENEILRNRLPKVIRVTLDERRQVISLRKGRSTTWGAELRYERPAEDRLILTGTIDGQDIRADLELVGMDTWKLFYSPFRWVRPPDPNLPEAVTRRAE